MLTFTLEAPKDEKFSYKLHKNPASPHFMRTDGQRNLLGFYKDEKTYFGAVSFGSIDEVEDLDTYATWNVLEISQHSLLTIGSIFNNILRSAVRGQLSDGITQEEIDAKYDYSLSFTPVFAYDLNRVETICERLELAFVYNSSNCAMTLTGHNSLHKFLQAANVVMFAHLNTRYERPSKGQVENIGKYINNLCKADDDKETVANAIAGRVARLQDAISTDIVMSDTYEEVETCTSLHDWKHDQIIANFLPDSGYRIVELGCGTGQFAFKLRKANKNVTYTGYDINGNNIGRSSKKVKNKNFHFIVGDILSLGENFTTTNVLMLLEVIEHLEKWERDYIVRLLNNVYLPEYIVITTPNKAANELLYGMAEGQLRHPDHKIEFFATEFLDFCSQITNYYIDNVIDTRKKENTATSPSFVVMLKRNPVYTVDEQFVETHKRKVDQLAEEQIRATTGFDIFELDYSVRTKQLVRGMGDRSYIKNHKDIFFMGSSISPADYTSSPTNGLIDGCIEHPQYVFDYYRTRYYYGELVAEKKEMGSRAYIWVCRNNEIAKLYNMPLVSVRSRNGYKFFTNEDEEQYVTRIHAEVYGNDSYKPDFIIFDAEITPWIYKAEKLIDRAFRNPVLAQLSGMQSYNESIAATGLSVLPVDNHVQFLSTLANYTRNEKVSIKIFTVLAVGHNVQGRNRDVQYHWNLPRANNNLRSYLANWATLLCPVEQVSGDDNILALWERVNNSDDCEGIVIKPTYPITTSGKTIQSAVKVRTNSYLQLIYGPNFASYTDRILRRNIGKKRARSIREQALGNRILQSFCNIDFEQRDKYLAAFISLNTMQTDGTL